MVKVAVTGGTGYVGSWCIHKLLEEGHEVVTTVRDPASAKCKFLHNWKSEGKKVECVKADLLDGEDVWLPILTGCDFVLHVASPFPLATPKHEDDLIKPAVSGAEIVVRSAVKAKVKRVVLTSSVVAIYEPPESKTYTAEDWSDTDSGCSAYSKSKTFAEKAAWAIVNSAEENPGKMEMAVINPSFILGPTPPGYDNTDFTSAEVVKKLMDKEFPMVPDVTFGIVDVRDVATAHVKAMTVPKAAGARFPLCAATMSMMELNGVCDGRWPERNLKISQAPWFLFQVLALFDAGAAGMAKSWGKKYTFDTSAASSLLGITFMPADAAVVAMTEKMVESKYVKEKPEGGGCVVM